MTARALSAARWVESFLVKRATCMAARSTLGGQLRAIESAVATGVAAMTVKAAHHQHGSGMADDLVDVADGARIWSQLSGTAQRILELKHSPRGQWDGKRLVPEIEDYEATVPSASLVSAEVALPETQGECGAATRSGYRCRLFRRHGQARCHLHAESRPEVEQTRNGEVLLEHLDPVDTPGRRAAVMGKRTLRHTNEAIGAALGMTERQVRVEVQAAYARISDWLIDREVRNAG